MYPRVPQSRNVLLTFLRYCRLSATGCRQLRGTDWLARRGTDAPSRVTDAASMLGYARLASSIISTVVAFSGRASDTGVSIDPPCRLLFGAFAAHRGRTWRALRRSSMATPSSSGATRFVRGHRVIRLRSPDGLARPRPADPCSGGAGPGKSTSYHMDPTGPTVEHQELP
jgi:hypothetical protein